MRHEPKFPSLTNLSDDDLLRRLSEVLQQSRRVESELVAHIGEVDVRRLYAREAAPSMFAYCTEVLNLSEHEAYLRITVARASREHPMLLEMLADGLLHLSAIAKLAPHLNEANRETLLARAVGKSKREIEELVAELAPKPDVPSTVRKLPERKDTTASPPVQLGPDRRLTNPSLATTFNDARHGLDPNQLGPDRVVTFLHTPTPKPEGRTRMEPLAPSRYKIQFTASVELRDKLERLRSLMRSSVPDGDLAAIIEEAVTEKLARLEAKRLAKTKSPRKSVEQADTSPLSRYIPAPVKRAIRARDGDQCAFVDRRGRRCKSREGLEFHHKNPYGRGGDRSPENLQLLCKAHNRYLAERDYGRDLMDRYRHSGSPASEPVPGFAVAGAQGGP